MQLEMGGSILRSNTDLAVNVMDLPNSGPARGLSKSRNSTRARMCAVRAGRGFRGGD